ncbi:hypothetical protein CK516_03525 [Nostoc sp. 'Peltigera malacea cyanobiont' DB3992]|nr:hypothetical protein CK516_03525 [Nostoc sp. 'Peltigera malacea cyanobiont' DB3992]
MPVPPAVRAPPPNKAKAALVAAAPEREDIATPVDAVPKVVANAIAAVGPRKASPAPATNPAPAVEPATKLLFVFASISSQSLPVISLS